MLTNSRPKPTPEDEKKLMEEQRNNKVNNIGVCDQTVVE